MCGCGCCSHIESHGVTKTDAQPPDCTAAQAVLQCRPSHSPPHPSTLVQATLRNHQFVHSHLYLVHSHLYHGRDSATHHATCCSTHAPMVQRPSCQAVRTILHAPTHTGLSCHWHCASVAAGCHSRVFYRTLLAGSMRQAHVKSAAGVIHGDRHIWGRGSTPD